MRRRISTTLIAISCASASMAGAQQSTANRLTTAEKAAGWRLLFDGKTLAGWRGLGYDTVPTAHWQVDNGAIRKIPSGKVPVQADGQPLNGGDLMTVDSFANFEFAFEWKVAPAANSGIKYNVSEKLSLTQSNHAALGFEYQIQDDSLGEDIKLATHRAGALYELIPANERKRLKPVGEWNTGKIVFNGNHGEQWLNGEKVVEFELGTSRMDSLLAKSKYRSIKGFADRRVGHLILQDHNDEAWYRNLKLRVLDK